jgi:hypothetical protein
MGVDIGDQLKFAYRPRRVIAEVSGALLRRSLAIDETLRNSPAVIDLEVNAGDLSQ